MLAMARKLAVRVISAVLNWLESGATLEPGPNMKLYQLKLSKEQLAAMPEKERCLLLLIGHILNEINILRKAALFCGNQLGDQEHVKLAEMGQQILFMRLLGGKTHEAWLAFERRFQKDKEISLVYAKPLADLRGEVWEKLKKMFGTENFIATLRNDHAFHNPHQADIERSFQKLPAQEDWSWYASDRTANCYNWSSDMVMTNVMFDATNKLSIREASDAFAEQVMATSSLVESLLAGLAEIMFEKYFPGLRAEQPVAELQGLPSVDEAKLPFFVAVPERAPGKGEA